MLCEALDRSAFTCGVSPFKQNHDALARVFNPVLKLQKLDLKLSLHDLIIRARHSLLVRITLSPGVHETSVLPTEHRLVIVVRLVEVEFIEMLGQIDINVE
jgi:hypothetical protein